MKVLVTGAAGFIGSNLCEYLLDNGCSVTGIDNFCETYDPRLKRLNLTRCQASTHFHLHEIDILDARTLMDCFEAEKPDVVVHLAALAGVRPSILAPGRYQKVNVEGTTNVLEAMRSAGVGHLVFGSSSSVYGERTQTPFRETDIVDHPVSPYAATKKSGELLCATYQHLFGISVDCLRFFTVYGPRQRPEMAISKFTDALISNRPITIYGDGTSARDYTFVSDIVRGIFASVQKPDGYRVINLGGRQPISLSKLVQVLGEVLSCTPELNYFPMQPGDVTVTCAAVDRAQKLLGFQSEVSILEGVQQFVTWFKRTQIEPSNR